MRLLIDTHVLIWIRREPHRLPQRVTALLNDNQQNIFVSAISAWEIGTKLRIGKLDFPQNFLDTFEDSACQLGFEPLALTAQHAVEGAKIGSPHKDPFDRMLAGQALVEDLKLVSADPHFRSSGIEPLW